MKRCLYSDELDRRGLHGRERKLECLRLGRRANQQRGLTGRGREYQRGFQAWPALRGLTRKEQVAVRNRHYRAQYIARGLAANGQPRKTIGGKRGRYGARLIFRQTLQLKAA